MKRRIPISIAAFCAMILAAFCANTHRAGAQPIPWNPPCVASKIVNTTGCAANVTITTNFGPVGPTAVAAGGTSPVIFPPGTVITGVITQAGTAVPVISPGPPIPPPGPGTPATGWVPGVVFGPPPGCCFDVYFDVPPPPGNGCYIWLMPGTPPCTP